MLMSRYKGHDLSFSVCFKLDSNIKTNMDNESQSAPMINVILRPLNELN